MKKIIGVFLYILYFNNILSSQVNIPNILGIWQFGTKEINAGWFDNYQFFPNDTFCFNTNQNDGVRRIISIGGSYKISGDTLILITKYSKEISGGYLVRSETAGRVGWEIKGGKLITIKFKKPKTSYLKIEYCKEQVGSELCILIDKVKYYKLEEDPYNYY